MVGITDAEAKGSQDTSRKRPSAILACEKAKLGLTKLLDFKVIN